MSYNITSIELRDSDLTMSTEAWRKWKAQERILPLPESNMPFMDPTDEQLESGVVPVRELWWCGEFSGTRYNDGTFAAFIADLQGSADCILVWEGGDEIHGLKIRDGQAYECPVQIELGPENLSPLPLQRKP